MENLAWGMNRVRDFDIEADVADVTDVTDVAVVNLEMVARETPAMRAEACERFKPA